MNAKTIIASLFLLSVTTAAAAQGTEASLPPVQVTAFATTCAHRALPTQRQVGEWTGVQNFAQAYDAREQLMADIASACRRPGIGRVQVVMQAQPAQGRNGLVAIAIHDRP